MLIAADWKDYELLDMSDGEKLERFGEYITVRPDPQVIWRTPKTHPAWESCHMHYHRSASGGGSWEMKTRVPERCVISYKDLRFNIRPTDFKHMGVFPEQAVNWDWISQKIKEASVKNGKPPKILNLFAYTGGATLACAAAGASVCHVDAAKAMNQWAKENIIASGLAERPVRTISDDVIKFVQREKRRESFYDAVIMDPPSYGRGPGGEVWKLEDSLFDLVGLCAEILTDAPLFFLLNSYTAGLSPTVAENILRAQVGKKFAEGKISSGEVGLKAATGFTLPCGVYARAEG